MSEVMFAFLYIAVILEALRLTVAWSNYKLVTLSSIARYLGVHKDVIEIMIQMESSNKEI